MRRLAVLIKTIEMKLDQIKLDKIKLDKIGISPDSYCFDYDLRVLKQKYTNLRLGPALGKVRLNIRELRNTHTLEELFKQSACLLNRRIQFIAFDPRIPLSYRAYYSEQYLPNLFIPLSMLPESHKINIIRFMQGLERYKYSESAIPAVAEPRVKQVSEVYFSEFSEFNLILIGSQPLMCLAATLEKDPDKQNEILKLMRESDCDLRTEPTEGLISNGITQSRFEEIERKFIDVIGDNPVKSFIKGPTGNQKRVSSFTKDKVDYSLTDELYRPFTNCGIALSLNSGLVKFAEQEIFFRTNLGEFSIKGQLFSFIDIIWKKVKLLAVDEYTGYIHNQVEVIDVFKAAHAIKTLIKLQKLGIYNIPEQGDRINAMINSPIVIEKFLGKYSDKLLDIPVFFSVIKYTPSGTPDIQEILLKEKFQSYILRHQEKIELANREIIIAEEKDVFDALMSDESAQKAVAEAAEHDKIVVTRLADELAAKQENKTVNGPAGNAANKSKEKRRREKERRTLENERRILENEEAGLRSEILAQEKKAVVTLVETKKEISAAMASMLISQKQTPSPAPSPDSVSTRASASSHGASPKPKAKAKAKTKPKATAKKVVLPKRAVDEKIVVRTEEQQIRDIAELNRLCEGGDLQLVQYHLATQRGNEEVEPLPVEHQIDGLELPLFVAVKEARVRIVKELLDRDADPYLQCPVNKMSPFDFARKKLHHCDQEKKEAYEKIDSLLGRAITNKLKDDGGVYSKNFHENFAKLISYCQNGCETQELEKFIVESGCPLQAPFKHSLQPLFEAVQAGKFNIVELLLQRGANPNILCVSVDGVQLSLIHIAAGRGHLNIVNLLLAHKDLDIPYILAKTPTSFVHLAVISRDLEMVSVLVEAMIKNNVSIDLLDIYGDTAIHIAVQRKDIEIIEYLISKGARLEISQESLQAVFKEAFSDNDARIVRILRELKMNPNFFDSDKDASVPECLNSPLHMAVLEQKIDILRELLLFDNINLDVLDEQKYSPLFYAISLSDIDSAKELIQKGARMDLTNGKGGNNSLGFAQEQLRGILPTHQPSLKEAANNIVQLIIAEIRKRKLELPEKIAIAKKSLESCTKDDIDFEEQNSAIIRMQEELTALQGITLPTQEQVQEPEPERTTCDLVMRVFRPADGDTLNREQGKKERDTAVVSASAAFPTTSPFGLMDL